MVTGLELFAAHFAEDQSQYVLIGGVATYLQLEKAELTARATKDLDIVLCVEALNPEFGRKMWSFIESGQYEVRQYESTNRRFYRFQKPATGGYPSMLEFFSREPGNIPLIENSHLTPVPFGEDVSSLSAILLHDDYYDFIHAQTTELSGVRVVSELCLIPLKARAWLDLSERAQAGEAIDSKDIRKHLTDVLRLAQLLDGEAIAAMPDSIRDDVRRFIEKAAPSWVAVDLVGLGIKSQTNDGLKDLVRRTFGIDETTA